MAENSETSQEYGQYDENNMRQEGLLQAKSNQNKNNLIVVLW